LNTAVLVSIRLLKLKLVERLRDTCDDVVVGRSSTASRASNVSSSGIDVDPPVSRLLLLLLLL